METEQKAYNGTSGVDSRYRLDRTEPIYMDIESCNTSYELRYVVAYEAAIRNKEVKQLLGTCIKEHNCEILKLKFGFSDEAIFYYRITHRDLFSVAPGIKSKDGLASISPEQKPDYTREAFVLHPICNKDHAVIVNGKPVVSEDDKISKASMTNYSDFHKLSFEPNFIRPKLIPVSEKNFYVNLNFELPLSEIVEYVYYLQKIYKAKDVKSALELLSSSIEFTDVKQIKINCKKYADMFYAHDYAIKFGNEFKNEDEMYKKIAMDMGYSSGSDKVVAENTIRTNISKMKSLVGDCGYLELLTGKYIDIIESAE